MKNFVITCSSTCDLTPYFLREHNIYYVSFYYYLDDNKFYDDFYKEHSKKDFYEMIKTKNVKTSQPDPEQYKELWLKLIEQGYDILHIELSSGISGAINSSLIARDMVLDIKKDANIKVIDSLCCSTGYGFLLMKAAKYKEEGKDIDATFEYVEKTKHNINHIFFINNLDQLIKGGRINKVAGSVGKLLNIIPIMRVDEKGKLEVVKKVRGINNVFDEVINMTLANVNGGKDCEDMFYYTHTLNDDLAKKFIDKYRGVFTKADIKDDYLFDVGTVIGAHTGDDTLSVFYEGNGRV